MPIDPLVLELLEQVDSGKTPEEACAAHPRLLEEVRARLGRLERVRGELDAIFPEGGPSFTARPPDLPTSTPAIPGHVVESVLGRGGMGVVYKARHLRLNRPVAIKMMINGGYASPPELARFLGEAEALAAVGHPNIVRIYEVGDIDGLPFFTMEFVEGGTLAQHLGGSPVPAERAAALLATLADAMKSTHEVGIVHRDLKPANILMATDGAPRVTDFGLAWRREGGAGLTRTGLGVGTPSYMAPEQATGGTAAFGPATDIYALGAILYEMLTGRPPFRGVTAVETEHQVVHDDPVPPTRLNSRVPRDLETICLKCLQKDPQRRYAGAAALAEDLRRFLRGESIAARRAGAFELAARWARRHPSGAATLAAGSILATAMLAAGAWLLAERAATARLVEADLAAAAAALRSSSWVEAHPPLERAKARLASGGPASLRRRLDRSWGELALAESLDDISQRAAESGRIDFDRPQTDRDYQAALRDLTLLEEAETPAQVAGRIATRDVRAAIVSALDFWAACTNDRARRRRLLEIARRTDPGGGSGWRARARDADVWRDRAAILGLAGEVQFDAESMPLLLIIADLIETFGQESVPFRRKIQAAHPDDFWANFGLAESLESGRTEEPLGFYRAAIAVRPRSAAAYVNLGVVLNRLGRKSEALESFQRAATVRPDSAPARRFLADGLLAVGRFEEAIAQCREAIRIDPNYTEAMGLLGVILTDQGKYAEARPYFARVIERYPAGHRSRDLGLAHLTLCDRALALELRIDAIEQGKARWANDGEAILCARLLLQKRHFGSAARIYAEVFAKSPQLVDEVGPNDRIIAAAAAASAGCGLGDDASAILDEADRSRFRSWAYLWLTAERDAQARRIGFGGRVGGAAVETLLTCLKEEGLACVRGKPGLARLPEREAQDWRSLWGSIEPLASTAASEVIAKTRTLAARRDWKWATEGYARALTLEPMADGEVWFEYAAVQLLAGDLPGYQRTCRAMLDRIPAVPNLRPYHAARACTLAKGPEFAANVARATVLATSELRNNGDAFWSLTEQGGLAHRAGRSSDAIPLLERSLQAERKPGAAVLNWFWLALAYRELGRDDLAGRWASSAELWFDQQGDVMSSDAQEKGFHLHNWLEALVLRRQAGQQPMAAEGG